MSRNKRLAYGGDPDYITPDGVTHTEEEMIEQFKESADDAYDQVDVHGYQFGQASGLQKLDPIAFREAFLDWIDGKERDGELDEYSADHEWLNQDDEYTSSKKSSNRKRKNMSRKHLAYGGDPDYITPDGNTYTEEEMTEQFKEEMSDVYPDADLLGYKYPAADALEDVDPTAFREAFLDWADSKEQDGELEEYSIDHRWLNDNSYMSSRKARKAPRNVGASRKSDALMREVFGK